MVTAEQFEQQRSHVRAVAYRMLGSLTDADDAVQETWLRLNRTDTTDIANLQAWLTTVTARICLDMLRSRTARREDPLDVRLPDPVVTRDPGSDPGNDPEQHAVLADSVGLALLVVLDTLSPAERLAFVLHDVFAVPFEQIAAIVDRSTDATKQLASRARRKVRGQGAPETVDAGRQREILQAFVAAARDGDFDALLAVLDPDVVLRADAGAGGMGPSQLIRGARAVAEQAVRFAPLSRYAVPVLVNGLPGFVAAPEGRPVSLLSALTRDGRIVELDILADPDRLEQLDLDFLAVDDASAVDD